MAIDSDRAVSAPGSNWPDYNPELTQLLQDRYSVGQASEAVVQEFQANGFECQRRRLERNEQTVVHCKRVFGFIFPLPISRVWSAHIYLDKDDRIERLFGAKYMDGP